MAPERSITASTDRPEALKSFVEGRLQFHTYLGNGSSDELEKASQLFEEAAKSDPAFDLAVFYHALTRAELRDSDTAIQELSGLIDKGVEFLPEAYLHLAYARTKKYCNEEFAKAEKALELATAEAKKARERKLKPVIQAYRVFLYSVMGGRLKNVDALEKKKYIDMAIRLGRKNLLKRLWRKGLIRLELHNALGIAYMRRGEQSEKFSEEQKKWWGLANKHFQAALDLRLSPVRVRQNIGTLLRIQGDQFRKSGAHDAREKAEDCYRRAIKEYEISIAVNPLDQFPHYTLARLYSRLGKWDLARERLNFGQRQRGVISSESWEQVERAIDLQDESILDERAD